MPNTVAYLALLVWPLVIVIMFRRLSIERALIWSILGGYLLLPQAARFDLPIIPLLDKVSIPSLTAFFVCTLLLRQKVSLAPTSMIEGVLVLLFVATPVATVLTNPEPILFAVGGLPGLRIYDSLSVGLGQVITLLPFFLARKLLATERALHEIMIALVVAGLAYSVPMLIEVRLSPQLNVWVYGFFQHGFDQMMRYGGYRPIVFLEHGLWVAFFALTTFSAALALARFQGSNGRPRSIVVAIYLGVMLLLCKSASPLIYALAIGPLILLAGNRLQIRIAALLVTVVVAYPLLRSSGVVPLDAIVSMFASIDSERASSLLFRIQNEDTLLTHAGEKPLFGWGAWGRNFVYDHATGQNLTTVDGRWVIVIGISGWFGYLGEFGLLAFSVLSLMKRSGRLATKSLSPYIGPLALVFAANLVDLLPNATLTSLTWMFGGAMLGYADALKAKSTPAARAHPRHGFKRPQAPVSADTRSSQEVVRASRFSATPP